MLRFYNRAAAWIDLRVTCRLEMPVVPIDGQHGIRLEEHMLLEEFGPEYEALT